MSEEPRVVHLADVAFEDGASAAVVHASPHSETRVLAPDGSNAGDDAWLTLPPREGGGLLTLHAPPAPGERAGAPTLAYRVLEAPGVPSSQELVVPLDPDGVRGNAFQVLFESPRAAGAFLSVTGGRAVDVGPESERTWVVLSGTGLVFLQNEVTLPLRAGDVALIPPGEQVRLWSRGPGDLRVVAFQPQAPPAPRRTLLSEVRRLREKERNVSGAGY